MKMQRCAAIVFTALSAFGAARADDAPPAAAPQAAAPAEQGKKGTFVLSGDAGYYTYGMNDVNNHFLNGRNGSFHGGMGYGAAVKFGFSENFAAKVGIDYLFASTDSTRTIGGNKIDTRVELPATMVFIGGEYMFLSGPHLDLKLIGGYTLVSIFNGRETGTNGSALDMGTVSGSGSGAQLGGGIELFLAKGLALEADLAYNYAAINGATFAGAPADPNSRSSTGVVDYSGLVAKLALNIFLFP